jgi:hypothetical protein
MPKRKESLTLFKSYTFEIISKYNENQSILPEVRPVKMKTQT